MRPETRDGRRQRWDDADIELLEVRTDAGTGAEHAGADSPFGEGPRRWSRGSTVAATAVTLAAIASIVVLTRPWATVPHRAGASPVTTVTGPRPGTGSTGPREIVPAPGGSDATGSSDTTSERPSVIDPAALPVGFSAAVSRGPGLRFASSWVDLHATAGATRGSGRWFVTVVMPTLVRAWAAGTRLRIDGVGMVRHVAADGVVTLQTDDGRNLIQVIARGWDDQALAHLTAGITVHDHRAVYGAGTVPDDEPAGVQLTDQADGLDPARRIDFLVATTYLLPDNRSITLTSSPTAASWDALWAFVDEPEPGAPTTANGHAISVSRLSAPGDHVVSWTQGDRLVQLAGPASVDELVHWAGAIRPATDDEVGLLALQSVAGLAGPQEADRGVEAIGTTASGLMWTASVSDDIHWLTARVIPSHASTASTVSVLEAFLGTDGPVLVRSDDRTTIVACLLTTTHAPAGMTLTTSAGTRRSSFVPVGDGSMSVAIWVFDELGPFEVHVDGVSGPPIDLTAGTS